MFLTSLLSSWIIVSSAGSSRLVINNRYNHGCFECKANEILSGRRRDESVASVEERRIIDRAEWVSEPSSRPTTYMHSNGHTLIMASWRSARETPRALFDLINLKEWSSGHYTMTCLLNAHKERANSWRQTHTNSDTVRQSEPERVGQKLSLTVFEQSLIAAAASTAITNRAH